jgi:hypothetical protein
MSLSIIDRKFVTALNATEKSFANGNSGAPITEKISILVDFAFNSSIDDAVVINSPNSLKLSDGSWLDKPFLVGDLVSIDFTATNIIDATSETVTGNYTVLSIDDDVIYFTTDFISSGFEGILLPSLGSGTVCEIVNINRTSAAEISMKYNWIENDSSFSLNSIIDGGINIFKASDVNLMSVTDVIDFVQTSDKSGIGFVSATLERMADAGTAKVYDIEITTFLPDIFEDISEPDWFVGDNTLKSVFQINALPIAGDPNYNSVKQSTNLEGNNGWINEEYNGNTPDFTLDSVTIEAEDTTILDAIDYNQKNTITAVILSDVEVADYTLKLSIIPPDTDFKNNAYTLLQNTLTSTYNSITTTYAEYKKLDRGTEISAAIETIIPASITLEFDIEFNADAIAYLNTLDTQEVRLTATLISNDGSPIDNEATILIWEGQTASQPIEDEEYKFVEESLFYLHDKSLADTVTDEDYVGCTEDDILYYTRFAVLREENSLNESIQTRVIVRKISDGTTFNLTSRTYNFADFVNFDDVTYFNVNEELIQYLDGDDRDIFSLNKVDTDATYYYVELVWSFFADWRFWVALAAASDEFYDLALPQDGKNNEWMRYLREAGYEIVLQNVITTTTGQRLTWEGTITLQDYEANLVSPTINTVIKYYDSVGDEVDKDSLPSDALIRVEATHTSVGGSFLPATAWGWLKIRSFQGEPSKWISTKWDWQSRNKPWQPLPSFSKAKITYPSADVAVVEALIDTSLLTSDKNTVVARMFGGTSTQLTTEENVKKEEINIIRLPDLATREDRGLSLCGRPFKVLAHVTDSTTWKNDVTGIAFKFDTMEVLLEKDGVEIPALGVEVSFPYQDDAVGFIIDWRQHQEDGVLLTGCYKIKINYTLGEVSGGFYYGSYNLLNYNTDTSEGDSRVYAILDDYVRESGINFRDSGFRNSVRFRGKFGWMQPNYDTENIIKTNRTREKVRNEALRSYKLEASYALSCLTDKIDYDHLLAASHIFISDYNKDNHKQYRDFPVILDEDSTPEYTYTPLSPYAKIVTQFLDKKALWESKFSGKSGIDQPKFGLDPISLGGGGGTCDPAGTTLNGTPLADTPSGSTKVMNIEYASGDPLTITIVTDTPTLTEGTVPNIPTPNNSLPINSGAYILGTFNSNDDADINFGRGGAAAPFFLLEEENPFGNFYALTGKTGGYQSYVDSLYYDKDGVATTEALAFPDDVILNWKSFKPNVSVLALSKTAIDGDGQDYLLNAAPYTFDSKSDWQVINGQVGFMFFSQGVFRDPFNYHPLNYAMTLSIDQIWSSAIESPTAGYAFTQTGYRVAGSGTTYKTFIYRLYTWAELGL